ncbi:flagellar L-ring protein [Desulfuromonas versatilis]|uniref:Flagellar L-ring protein n=1 Tax=Desulfuromonas versatilis TaxID=2802975 RepID=A0ABM8HZT6_9BACT|nr:flagellar basal body L-ring protein FlgH [Desulfuromonas versatilis]BCR06610.1 flagellar L-ring protein [Desulfuromonas versatilis]
MKQSLLLLILPLLAAGCAPHSAGLDSATALPPAPAVVIEPPTPKTPGSLWTDQQGGLFYDVKARSVGDIVTVAIFEAASASKEAQTSTGRSSSASAGIDRLFGLEKNIGTINSAIDPSQLVNASYDSDFEGSGKTSRKEDLVATLTTQVIEVLPNGNLRIEGSKAVTVNNEQQIIKLSGVVRQPDVSAQNIVDSKNILDARITYTGKGVISDKQGQGWLVRILDNVWPF